MSNLLVARVVLRCGDSLCALISDIVNALATFQRPSYVKYRTTPVTKMFTSASGRMTFHPRRMSWS